MTVATLAQGNQVLNLILQKKIEVTQLQYLIESGLLSDLLDANPKLIDREFFRVALGLGRLATKEEELGRCLDQILASRYAPTCLTCEKEVSFSEVAAGLTDAGITNVIFRQPKHVLHKKCESRGSKHPFTSMPQPPDLQWYDKHDK